MIRTRVKISRHRLAQIIREAYRDHEARGLPRPSEDQLSAAAGLPPGFRLWRLTNLARAMRDKGELPDLPRADRAGRPPSVDRAAVAEAIVRTRAGRRPAPAAPPPGRPADPRADLLREHLERERRIRRWAAAHEEVPCRCD